MKLMWVINLFIAVILIVGGYQFYFLPQRSPIMRSPRSYLTRLDEHIPFLPGWVWIYSGLYYPVIIFLSLSISTFKEFNLIAFSFILLLITQLMFFFFLPVHTPEHWRAFEGSNSKSVQFLSFVQKFDSRSNCFPSMHVSVAMLTALHLIDIYNSWGNITYLFYFFPLLIALSTLFTKQHYLIDLPSGAILGWLIYEIFMAYSVLTF